MSKKQVEAAPEVVEAASPPEQGHVGPPPEVVALMQPGPEGLDPATAFRMAGGSVWLVGDEAGGYFAYRSLPTIEGWVKLPDGVLPEPAGEDGPAQPLVGPDGLPLTPETLSALHISEPPGGGYATVYALPGHTEALYAANMAGDFRLLLTENIWERVVQEQEKPVQEKPASEMSMRLRRLRGLA